MPIELTIRVTSPLTPDDHELLSGCAVMVLAIANHELAKAKFPEAFGDDAETPEAAPAPCGYVDPTNPILMCVGEVGHRGRHRFRPFPADAGGSMSRAN
jgi:hypothetical protein